MDTTAPNKDAVRQSVRAAFEQIDHLPPAPETMVALWKVIDLPDTTLDALSAIIAADAALSLSLLKLVNSVAFALSRRITSVREAVHFVGFGEVKTLSIAIVVKTGLLVHAPKLQCFDRIKLWRHMVGTALASQIFARRVGRVSLAEEAFTAGLLQDIGFIILDTAAPDGMQKVIAIAESMAWELEEVETRLLGFTHGDVGVWLGQHWNLPQALLTPMAEAWRAWEAPSQQELCALVHVGNVLALEESTLIRTRKRPQIDPRALKLLGADTSQLEACRQELRNDLIRVAKLLEIRS